MVHQTCGEPTLDPSSHSHLFPDEHAMVIKLFQITHHPGQSLISLNVNQSYANRFWDLWPFAIVPHGILWQLRLEERWYAPTEFSPLEIHDPLEVR